MECLSHKSTDAFNCLSCGKAFIALFEEGDPSPSCTYCGSQRVRFRTWINSPEESVANANKSL